jgi:hypothetical protein
MKQHLALLALAAACVSPAEAQNRRPPRRPDASTPTPAPSSDAGPRDTRWVTQRGAGAWQPRCVASVGCAAPQVVPRCAALSPDAGITAPQNFAQVIDERLHLAGQRVAVRGRLSAGGGCTEMACPDGVCCNHCGGAVALTGRATTSLRQVSLGAEGDPLYTCTGDDSGLCCGTAVPAGDVVVRGVLRPVPGSGGAWRIESPTLCAE